MMTSTDRVRVAIDDPNELVSATLLRIGYRPADAIVVTTLREQGQCLVPGSSVIASLPRARRGLSDMDHIPRAAAACVTMFITQEPEQSDAVRTALSWAARQYDVVAWSAVVGPAVGNMTVHLDGRWEWSGRTSLVKDLACSAVGNAAVVAGHPFRWDARDTKERWAHSVSASHVRLLEGAAPLKAEVQAREQAHHDTHVRAWNILTNNADEVSVDLAWAFESREFRDAVIAACLVGCHEDVLRLNKSHIGEVFASVFSGDWSGQLHPDARNLVASMRFATYYLEGAARWNVLVSLGLIAWVSSDTAAAWDLCQEIPADADVSLRVLLTQAMSVGLNIRCNDVA